MKDAKTFFSKLRQRSEATKEVADSINKKRAAGLYIEGMKEVDTTLHETKIHCRYVAFLTILMIVILLEALLPKFSSVYSYVTVPIYGKLLFFLTDVLHLWGWILAVLIILDIVIAFKRPEWWEDLLIKIPFVHKITLALYFYRYFWSRSFIEDDEKALKTTGNSTFSLDKESTTAHHTSSEYPLLYAAIEYIQGDEQSEEDGTKKPLKRTLSHDDYVNFAKYAKTVFIDACYDFKELFSYTCMFSVIVITLIMMVMYVETF